MEFKANDARGAEFLSRMEKGLESQEKVRQIFESFIIKNDFKGYHIHDGWVKAPNGLEENITLKWKRGSISHGVWKPDVVGSRMVIVKDLPSLPYELIFQKKYLDRESNLWKNVKEIPDVVLKSYQKDCKPFRMYCYEVAEYKDGVFGTDDFYLKFNTVKDIIFDVHLLNFSLYKKSTLFEKVKRLFN